MLVGESVCDGFRLRNSGEDVLGHLVHGSLDTGAVIRSKPLESDVTGRLPGLIELAHAGLDGLVSAERLPRPAGVHVGGENPVPGLGQGGVLVTDETVERRSGALQDAKTDDAAGDGDAILAADGSLDVPCLAGVLDEAVGVRLAVDGHALPVVGDDLDMGSVDVAVLLDEVRAQKGGEVFRGCDGVLLGKQVDGVLDGVGRDNDAVVGLGVGGLDVTLEQTADGHFSNSLDTSRLVAVDLVDSDIVLAVASSGYVRHGER